MTEHKEGDALPGTAVPDTTLPGTAVLSTSVQHCVNTLRSWFIEGRLLPGQVVNQVQVARALGISKIPVREALSILANGGVLEYSRGQGYVVRRFTLDELGQVYRMRNLIESNLLQDVKVNSHMLADLVSINAALYDLVDSDDSTRLSSLNTQFHFTIFSNCGAPLIVEELRRLWDVSALYRTSYIYKREARLRTFAEHDEMIEALREENVDELVLINDRHRQATKEHLKNLGALVFGPSGETPAAV